MILLVLDLRSFHVNHSLQVAMGPFTLEYLDFHVKMVGSFMDVSSYVGESLLENVKQRLDLPQLQESFPCEAPCSGSLPGADRRFNPLFTVPFWCYPVLQPDNGKEPLAK